MFINMILKVKGPQATCLLHPFYQLFQKSPLSLCNPLRRSKMPSTKAEVVLPSILFSRNHLSSNRRLHWFIYGFIWTTGSPPKRFEKKRHVQVMEPRGPVVIDSSIHWPLKTWNVKKNNTTSRTPIKPKRSKKFTNVFLQNQYSILLPTVLHAPFYVSSWWSSSLSTFGSFKIPTESSRLLRKQPGQLIFLMKKYRIMLQGLYSFFQKASRPKKVRFHHHQKIGEVQPSQVAKTWATPPLHPSAIETLPPRLARFWWEIMPWHLLHVLDVFWSETCMWRAFFFIAFNDVVFSGKIYLSIER